ncbi:MAG: hypothetical protein KDI88_04515 [Gammaproteobacteria bacterium]|nr:hypothetical protein [Gammaproteobacteria bacterium]
MLDSRAMSEFPVDLNFLRERLAALAAELADEAQTGVPADPSTSEPGQLCDALLQLIGLLSQLDGERTEPTANIGELNTLGEYGLHLLEDLAAQARRIRQAAASDIEHLSLPFALWVARRGGEIRNLGPVVNALAYFANQNSRPAAMTTLYGQCCEIIEAASPASQENFVEQAAHPYRMLLLNRAIVATRSQNPELIEIAFDSVLDVLPNDAQSFFAEAMEQMALVDYPEYVRDIVRRYFVEHARPRRLH